MGRSLPATSSESLESPGLKERGGHVLLGFAHSYTGRHTTASQGTGPQNGKKACLVPRAGEPQGDLKQKKGQAPEVWPLMVC